MTRASIRMDLFEGERQMTIENNTSLEGTLDTSVESKGKVVENDVVPRENFRQILDEKKKVQQENAAMKARLDMLEAEQKSREEQKLIAEKQWEELAKRHENEARQAKELLAGQVRQREDDQKKSLLSSELKLKADQYWKLIDLDDVPNEPEALKAFAQEFKRTHPDIVTASSLTPPPGTVPQSSAAIPRPAPKNENDFRAVLAEYNRSFAERIVQGGSFSDVFKK